MLRNNISIIAEEIANMISNDLNDRFCEWEDVDKSVLEGILEEWKENIERVLLIKLKPN